MSKADSATLEYLVRDLVDPCDDERGSSSRRLGEDGDGFMPLVVERVGSRVYSLTHYYKQNGDMMCDPDVMFFRDDDGKWFPMTFRQDGGIRPQMYSALRVDSEAILSVYPRRYASLRDFVRLWLRNLRVQQGIA